MVLLSHSRFASIVRKCAIVVVAALIVWILLSAFQEAAVRQSEVSVLEVDAATLTRFKDLANEEANSNERLIFEKLDSSYDLRSSSPSDVERRLWRTSRELVSNCASDQLKQMKCHFFKEDRFPIVVWWIPFTFYKHSIRRCSLGRCMFTHNRRELTNPRTRAFLYYGTSFDPSDLPLPRAAYHEWVLLHEESPKNVFMFNHAEALSVFNLTSTFRRESDFPLTLQWLKNAGDLLDRTFFVPTDMKNAAIAKEGLARVVYIQSDCNAPSDRDHYVRELMKHIKVDSLGACLHNRDLPQSLRDPLTFEESEFLRVTAKYKFAIAMENAVCPDYITEKLWRPLRLGSVPIYFGSPSVRDWLPNNQSAILVNDFASPKQLAQFLKELDADDAKYERYLGIKLGPHGITNKRLLDSLAARTWSPHNPDMNNFVDGFECFVCDKIYESLLKKANGQRVQKRTATKEHYGCPEPKVIELINTEGSRSGEVWRMDWGADWRNSQDDARALQEMLLAGAKDSHNFQDYLAKQRAAQKRA